MKKFFAISLAHISINDGFVFRTGKMRGYIIHVRKYNSKHIARFVPRGNEIVCNLALNSALIWLGVQNEFTLENWNGTAERVPFNIEGTRNGTGS